MLNVNIIGQNGNNLYRFYLVFFGHYGEKNEEIFCFCINLDADVFSKFCRLRRGGG